MEIVEIKYDNILDDILSSSFRIQIYISFKVGYLMNNIADEVLIFEQYTTKDISQITFEVPV